MRNFITPVGEEYPFGGPGKFILGTVQAMAEQLRQEYANTVDLIYIDPPFGTGDGFSVKLPGVREKVKIPAYSDSMDTASYLEMMRGVLTLCHDLLKYTGSVYVHIDYRMCARIRLMLDEIFGESCFQNEIIWAYKSGGRSVRHYSRKHDNILFYRKSAKAYFDISAVGVPRGPMKRNNMKRTGYATQKPEALLRRIISASCPEGGLVADLFGGSGTTAAVAAKLNRRFLTIDASPASLGIVRKRLLSAGYDVSLIKQSSALALSYPALPEGEFDADFTFSRDAFGAYVQLDSFRSKFGLSFMAFGTVDGDGIFRPAEYTLFPTVGSHLSDSACRADTVQLCDNAGGMRFYRG